MSTFVDKVERAKALIGENTQRYPNCAAAISFGKDSIVLLDLVMKVDPSVPVFAVLADTEFQETLEFRDQVLAYYTLDYSEYNFTNDAATVFEVDIFGNGGASWDVPSCRSARGAGKWSTYAPIQG